jgi:hypothetical protein
MWERYKIFIITLTALLGAMAVFAFGPHAEWKCPSGSGLVSGMCVPGAVAPVRE